LTSKVTAIVRCHNNESTIERALRSLVDQDLGGALEILAVDDASTDGSWRKMEPFAPRVVTMRLQPNRGALDAGYAGLERASGEYVFFLDADDWAEPDMARSLAAALDSRPEAAFAYCDYVEEDGGSSRRVHVERVADMVACNAMFRREALLREGFWNKTFLLPEYDLVARLLRRHGAVRLDRSPYHYCRHDASMTRQDGFFERAMRQLDESFGALAPSGRFQDLRMTDVRPTASAGSKEN
jgi:glycosyltransferase involved in cell wall biosynthesis